MKTIKVTDEQYKFLTDLSKKLKTQNNRRTNFPLFVVYDKQLISTDSDADTYEWVDEDYHRVCGNEESEEITHIDEMVKRDEDLAEEIKGLDYKEFCDDREEVFRNHLNCTLIGYAEVDRFRAIFFSEKAAKEFIEEYYYRFNKPFIYAESATDNDEIITLLEIIKSLTKSKPKK